MFPYSPYYPDDTQGWHVCYMEGCIGKGNCPRCGKVNYHLLGYYGAVARWAKAWGLSQEEAEKRIEGHEIRRAEKEDGIPVGMYSLVYNEQGQEVKDAENSGRR